MDRRTFFKLAAGSASALALSRLILPGRAMEVVRRIQFHQVTLHQRQAA